MEICIEPFFRDKQFKGKSEKQIIQILKQIPYFNVISNNQNIKASKVKVQYENADRILLITGISHPFLNNLLKEFGQGRRFLENPKIVKNQYWSSVEYNNPDTALAFKKFLRTKKISYDLESNQNYRLPKRKVRIVLLMEDFFTILLDIIA